MFKMRVSCCQPDGEPPYAPPTPRRMPNISARMVPLLHKFCTDHLAPSTTAA